MRPEDEGRRHGVFYEPDGATLERFLCSDAEVRGLRGPFGSGKSTACLVDLIDRAMHQAPGPDGKRRTRWGIVRNSYPELLSTTLKDFEIWAPSSVCTINRSARPIEARLRCRLEDRTIVDAEFLFVSLDSDEDIKKLLSLQLTGAYVNEAREIPWVVVDKLKDRTGRFPRVIDGGPTWSGMIMDTNPPDTESWWYRLAEEETPEGWEFFAQPPGDGPNAENLRWLKPGYYDQLKRGKSQDEIKVYVRGEYAWLQEGRPVYSDYQDHLHCGDRVILPDRDLALHVGLDFGWSAAAVFVQVDADNRADVLGEIVRGDKTTGAFAELVLEELATTYRGHRIGSITGDPAGLASSPLVSEDQPRTAIDICRAVGLHVEPAETNAIGVRVEAVARMLRTIRGGRPLLQVSKQAVELRRGFNGRYRYRKLKTGGDERYSEAPEKNEASHPHDALQYVALALGHGREAVRPARPDGAMKPGKRTGRKYLAWTRGA